jgi:LPXTG-motif cell wall-anchored protein
VNHGDAVRWTYVVTNIGDVPLTDVTVTDDKVDASDIDCDSTGGNVVAGPLEAGASFTCEATGEAIVGQYANMGSVTGVGPSTTDVDGQRVDGQVVADEDPSHYLGLDVRIDIEKATNGQDADEETGPLVALGGAVRWTYVVTNTGTSDLTDVTVTDDMVDASEIDCDDTGGNVIAGPLTPGASFTCVANGTAVLGQYANMGTVTGIGPAVTDVDGDPLPGVEVSDEDPSHYFGVEPAVDIEKSTNGEDADEPTGPTLTTGGEVRWTYIVTNTGNVPLTELTVTDDVEDASGIDCDGTGGNSVVGPLAPGESFTCLATGTATVGQYANLGTVTALGPTTTDVDGDAVDGVAVTDEDWSHYRGVAPATVIQVLGNLAQTGGGIGTIPIAAGVLLLVTGTLLLVRRRRARSGAVV